MKLVTCQSLIGFTDSLLCQRVLSGNKIFFGREVFHTGIWSLKAETAFSDFSLIPHLFAVFNTEWILQFRNWIWESCPNIIPICHRHRIIGRHISFSTLWRPNSVHGGRTLKRGGPDTPLCMCFCYLCDAQCEN